MGTAPFADLLSDAHGQPMKSKEKLPCITGARLIREGSWKSLVSAALASTSNSHQIDHLFPDASLRAYTPEYQSQSADLSSCGRQELCLIPLLDNATTAADIHGRTSRNVPVRWSNNCPD